MHTKENKFEKKLNKLFTFARKDEVRKICALFWYITLISVGIDIPHIIQVIWLILFLVSLPLTLMVVICAAMDMEEIEENPNKEKVKINIAKEIIMFIPILLLKILVTTLFCEGISENEASVNEAFRNTPVSELILACIGAPIVEEFMCRFLPYKFIDNKILYIIFSSIVFASLHVVNDPNAFYYFWFYMITPIYYAYRYQKTERLLVPITLHSFSNLVSSVLTLIQM